MEINRALRGAYAITLLYGVENRMFAYAQGPNVEFIPTKVTNFKWRNGFVYGIGDMAKSVGMPDPCPMHTEYLEYGKANVSIRAYVYVYVCMCMCMLMAFFRLFVFMFVRCVCVFVCMYV